MVGAIDNRVINTLRVARGEELLAPGKGACFDTPAVSARLLVEAPQKHDNLATPQKPCVGKGALLHLGIPPCTIPACGWGRSGTNLEVSERG